MNAPEIPAPDGVMNILYGYWPAKIVSTAVELGVFTELSGDGRTADALAGRLGLRMPGLGHFLLALEGIGLLESTGNRYRNAPSTQRYLVAGSPEYLGGYVTFCDREMKPAWDGLATALRTGEPQNPAAVAGNPYDALYRDDAVTGAFLDSMDLFSRPAADVFSGFDWTGHRSFVDVGGARGSFAYQLVARHPHLDAAVFDLPALEPAFDAFFARLGPGRPVTFHGGDFFRDPLPRADVVVFGHVLHNWDVEARIELLRKAYDAVPPGGVVYVYDPMISVEGAPPLNAVMTSLDMLVWSRGGGEYSVADCHAWLTETGFHPRTVELPDQHEDMVVMGLRPR